VLQAAESPCIVALMTTYLSDLVSVLAFERDIRDGFISERKHEADDSLRVYTYTPKTQFSGRWTNETRLARGLILRVPETGIYDAQVVGRGLPKYFTISQLDSDWGKAKLIDDDEGVTVEESAELSWDAPAFVADKMNGALGLAYNAPDGLAISTKGSFGSPEAGIATRWLREHLTLAEQVRFSDFFNDSTALFEIITPERQHPVDYGDTEELFFLGSVRHSDGRWTPADSSHFLVTDLRFHAAEPLEHRTLREAVEAPYRENTEGMVVTLDDEHGQHLYKVKSDEYLALRRAFYAVESTDIAADLVSLSSEELEALTAEDLVFPKGMRNIEAKRRQLDEDLLKPLAVKLSEVRAEYRKVRGDELPDRPTFARLVKATGLPAAYLFKAYDEEVNDRKSIASSVFRDLMKDLKKNNG